MPTNTNIEEIKQCCNSCIYFIETYLHIILSNNEKKFLMELTDGRFHIIASPIKSNNTLLMHSLLLWKALFKDVDRTYLIATPKLKHAIAYNTILRDLFNLLPEWMKLDTFTMHKKRIHFSNNNNIIFGTMSCDSVCGITITDLYIHGLSFIPKERADDFTASYLPCMACIQTSNIYIESYPYMRSTFDEMWESKFYKQHGRREYNYPLKEGVENGI